MAIGSLLKTSEVAEKLGVSVFRVAQFVKAGRIKPAAQVGTAYLFETEEVRKFKAIKRKNGRPKKKS